MPEPITVELNVDTTLMRAAIQSLRNQFAFHFLKIAQGIEDGAMTLEEAVDLLRESAIKLTDAGESEVEDGA
jgi:hypothetical protein